jgi:hypothetical protein
VKIPKVSLSLLLMRIQYFQLRFKPFVHRSLFSSCSFLTHPNSSVVVHLLRWWLRVTLLVWWPWYCVRIIQFMMLNDGHWRKMVYLDNALWAPLYFCLQRIVLSCSSSYGKTAVLPTRFLCKTLWVKFKSLLIIGIINMQLLSLPVRIFLDQV